MAVKKKIMETRLSLINTLIKDKEFSEGQPRHRQQTLSMNKFGLQIRKIFQSKAVQY